MSFRGLRPGILLLVVALVSCRETPRLLPSSSTSSEEVVTYGKMTEAANLILAGTVQEVKNWKDREDWWIVTLKPEEVLKGKAPSQIQLLDQKLFPKQPSFFSSGEKVLVFLKDLPAYTAWAPMVQQGVRYELLGKEHGLVKGEGEQKNIGEFVRDFLSLLKKPVSLSPLSGIKDFFFDQLFWNPSKPLKDDLIQEIFERSEIKSLLTSEDLGRLAARVGGPDFPDPVKIQIVRGIVSLPPQNTEDILKGFFCLSPTEVCLRSAEALESRGERLGVEAYAQALENGPVDLKVGLLEILGRHHREDAFALFENTIAETQDEKKVAPMIESLGELGGARAETLLIKYGKDRRYYVRLAVVKALGTLRSEKGMPLMEAALKTTDPTMVMVGAQALERIGTPKAYETLGKYYEKEHHGYWEPTAPQHFIPK